MKLAEAFCIAWPARLGSSPAEIRPDRTGTAARFPAENRPAARPARTIRLAASKTHPRQTGPFGVSAGIPMV